MRLQVGASQGHRGPVGFVTFHLPPGPDPRGGEWYMAGQHHIVYITSSDGGDDLTKRGLKSHLALDGVAP